MKRHDKYRQLRMLRAGNKWTQFQLALKANINQSRVSLIENGWDDPTEDERKQIAKAFQLSEADVFPAPSEQVAS